MSSLDSIDKVEENKKPDDDKQDPCSICMDDIPEDDVFKTPCKHVFHKDCLKTWFVTQSTEGKEQTCPLCRRELQGVLDDMPENDRESYLQYAGIYGVEVQYRRQKLVTLTNMMEMMYQSSGMKSMLGDMSGFANNFNTALDNSIDSGDDVFGLRRGHRRTSQFRPNINMCMRFVGAVVKTKIENTRRSDPPRRRPQWLRDINLDES